VLSLLLLSTAAKHYERGMSECMWHDYLRHDRISAWEFQAQPHRHMVSVLSAHLVHLTAHVRRIANRHANRSSNIQHACRYGTGTRLLLVWR
jgi:hypothetical protein